MKTEKPQAPKQIIFKEDYLDFPIPTGRRILVKPVKAPRKNSMGLFIPDTEGHVAKTKKGEVVYVSDAISKSENICLGDIVMYNTYEDIFITHKGQDYLILYVDTLYCVQKLSKGFKSAFEEEDFIPAEKLSIN